MKQPRFEIIEAWDHWSQAGWARPDDFYGTLLKKAGWVVREDKQYVYLAASRDSAGNFGNIGGVLKAAIIKRKRVRV